MVQDAIDAVTAAHDWDGPGGPAGPRVFVPECVKPGDEHWFKLLGGGGAPTAAASDGPFAGRPTIVYPLRVTVADLLNPHSDVWGGFTNAVKNRARRSSAGAYMVSTFAGHYVSATRAREFVAKVRAGLEAAAAYRANRPNVAALEVDPELILAVDALEYAVRDVDRDLRAANEANEVAFVRIPVPACTTVRDYKLAVDRIVVALDEAERATREADDNAGHLRRMYGRMPWKHEAPKPAVFSALDHLTADASSSSGSRAGETECGAIFHPSLVCPPLNGPPFVKDDLRLTLACASADRANDDNAGQFLIEQRGADGVWRPLAHANKAIQDPY